jgi:hypothetical protein
MAMNGKKDIEMAEENPPKRLGRGRRNRGPIGIALQPRVADSGLCREKSLKVPRLFLAAESQPTVKGCLVRGLEIG